MYSGRTAWQNEERWKQIMYGGISTNIMCFFLIGGSFFMCERKWLKYFNVFLLGINVASFVLKLQGRI